MINKICQIFFGLSVLCWIVTMWFWNQILYMLPADELTKQKRCITAANWCFRGIFWTAPWVSVNGLEGHQKAWNLIRADVKAGKSIFIMLNHTSFLDAIIFSAFCPTDIIVNLRTLLKASLTKIPLFGDVVNKCGHFPVHFKSQTTGNFSLDKTQMAHVMNKVLIHVNQGGSIVFFPEGQIGKEVGVIQSLRRGSFNMAIDNDMAMYSLIMVGNEVSWPVRATMGGFPNKIHCSLQKVERPSDFDCTQLSDMCRVIMQKQYDDIVEKNSIKQHSA